MVKSLIESIYICMYLYQVRGSVSQSLHHTGPYFAGDHPGMGSYTASSPDPFSGVGVATGEGTAGRG